MEEFYSRHRGGSGNVIVVMVFGLGHERHGVFSSIERAREWAVALGDEVSCVFVPYVVDEPDFGNVKEN